MARFVHRVSQTAGQTPGTPTYVGRTRDAGVTISRFEYDAEGARREVLDSPEEASAGLESGKTCWLNIDGVHDVQKIERIGEGFGLHSLLVEDVVHTGQRPKVEDYDAHLFIVLRMLQWNR
jgi:magnesium transporter